MDFNDFYQSIKKKMRGFGEKPIEDVGRIMNYVQSSDVKEKEFMGTVQKVYMKLFQERGFGDQNQARQSWVVASGNNFEQFVRNVINEGLNKIGILAVKGDQLRTNPKAQEIVEFLTLKASRRCTQTNTGIWPDSDVVVLTQEEDKKLKVFALLNCKTSDHSRNDAVLFWALALRDNNIKYCLVTQDLDKKFAKGDQEASSHRKKSEAYLDRVYSTHPLTTECSQVRKLDFSKSNGAEPLFRDLIIWREEVVPNYLKTSINENILM